MTYEEIVNFALELRKKFERSECEFFLGLAEIEAKYMSVLRKHEIREFGQFLRSYELCRPERYYAFLAGLRRTTPSKVFEVGVPSTMALGRASSVSKAGKVIEAADAWREENNGLTPRYDTAHRLLRQVDPVAEVPAPVRAKEERERLREENAELHRTVARLEREKYQLLAKIAKLEGKARPRATA